MKPTGQLAKNTPSTRGIHMTNEAKRDPWLAEADAIEFNACDFDVAGAAELPAELAHHTIAAAEDKEFENEHYEWLDHLLNAGGCAPLLALEQSCNETGILLPWDMRGVRLWTAPREAVDLLHRFWDGCPRHVSVHLSHYIFWLVRAERGRRRETCDWSPRHPLPPPEPEERAFFRPSKLVVRRYS